MQVARNNIPKAENIASHAVKYTLASERSTDEPAEEDSQVDNSAIGPKSTRGVRSRCMHTGRELTTELCGWSGSLSAGGDRDPGALSGQLVNDVRTTRS